MSHASHCRDLFAGQGGHALSSSNDSVRIADSCASLLDQDQDQFSRRVSVYRTCTARGPETPLEEVERRLSWGMRASGLRLVGGGPAVSYCR